MLSKSEFATLIVVRNMERALKFYTKTLGAKLQMRADGEMKDSWASVRLGKEEFWLVNPPGPKPKKVDLAFNAFIVKDIKKEVQDLRKKGVKFEKAEKMNSDTVVDGAVATDSFGATAFFNDSEGNLLMLWQNMM
jgi:catechol 2,3-dioxygenase-like lactoylglutathione lyase family enzyme